MASDDRFGILSPMGNQPPSSAFATIDLVNSTPVLNFDDSVEEHGIWSFPRPLTMSPSNASFKATLLCAMASATSGAVVVRAQIERQQNDGADSITSDSFSAGSQTTQSVPAVAGTYFQVVITLSNSLIDSLTFTDFFRVRISRLATNAADTATGDMRLVYGEIGEL